MEEMSGGVAHELNSPLAALSFAIQRLQRRISRGREVTHQDLSEQLDKMSADAVRRLNANVSVFIMKSGFSEMNEQDALNRGVDAFFYTPYRLEELLEELKAKRGPPPA